MTLHETRREQFLQLAGGLYDRVVSRAGSESDDTLGDIEQQAEDAGRDVAVQLLTGRLAVERDVDEQHTVLCTQCGKSMRWATDPSVRHLDTAFGVVRYERRHAACDDCRSSFSPLDRRLAIPVRGPSNHLRRKVCEASRAGSFGAAARVLRELAGIDLSVKRVQLITRAVGTQLCERRDKATDAFLTEQAYADPPDEPAGLLVISADGGRIQTRQESRDKKWKEDKVGIVYDAIPVPEESGKKYAGPKPHIRSVVATMAPWERLGDHLSALADRRRYAWALLRIFISDGAQGIRSLRERCFPDAVFILDWAHATEHLHLVAIAAYGPGPKADAWFEKQKDRLWRGRADLVIRNIDRLCRKVGKPPKRAAENDPRRILANNLEYFRTNRDAIDYPTFRKNGWPIGSGIVEATIKQIGRRVKGTDKHWSMPGAEQILQVVAQLIADDHSWDDFWAAAPGVAVA